MVLHIEVLSPAYVWTADIVLAGEPSIKHAFDYVLSPSDWRIGRHLERGLSPIQVYCSSTQ